jgi:hypothetical protein
MIGMFCATNWNAPTPCSSSPRFTFVAFANALVDGTALGSFTPTRSRIVGAGFSISPSVLSANGKAFRDVYR